MSDRFWSKVKKGRACWEWTASTYSTGYGAFWADGAMQHAHRFSYRLHRGPIPPGIRVLHKCDNRKCVRPDHLFLGTGLENSWDMMRKHRHTTKLTEEQVLDIYHSSQASRPLAAAYGVSGTLIKKIKNRQIWRHLTDGRLPLPYDPH